MSNFYQSNTAVGKHPVASGQDSDEVVYRAIWALASTTVGLGLNDIIELGVLPANYTLSDVTFDADQFDSNGAPTLTFDAGLLTGGASTPQSNPGNVGVADLTRAVGTDMLSGSSAIGRTATGSTVGATQFTCDRIRPVGYDRSIGLKVKAAPATAVVSAFAGTNFRGTWQPGTAYALHDWIVTEDGVRLEATAAGTSSTAATGLVVPYYNGATVTDGGVTWTVRDPVLGVTVRMRPKRYGT